MLLFSTYQTPDTWYPYVAYHSHHKQHVLEAFIRGELIRYAVTKITPAGSQRLAAIFWQRLLARGHPVGYLPTVFASMQHVDRLLYLQATSLAGSRSRGALVLVSTNLVHDGRFETQGMNLNKVVNIVYANLKHSSPELGALSGDKVVEAHSNPPVLIQAAA